MEFDDPQTPIRDRKVGRWYRARCQQSSGDIQIMFAFVSVHTTPQINSFNNTNTTKKRSYVYVNIILASFGKRYRVSKTTFLKLACALIKIFDVSSKVSRRRAVSGGNVCVSFVVWLSVDDRQRKKRRSNNITMLFKKKHLQTVEEPSGKKKWTVKCVNVPLFIRSRPTKCININYSTKERQN